MTLEIFQNILLALAIFDDALLLLAVALPLVIWAEGWGPMQR